MKKTYIVDGEEWGTYIPKGVREALKPVALIIEEV